MTGWRRVIGEFGKRCILILRGTLVVVFALYVLGAAGYLVLRLIFGDSPWWLSLINSFSTFIFLPAPFLLLIELLLQRRPRWLLLAMAAITLVAVIRIGPYFAPKASAVSASTSGTTLRVVTFNAWTDNNQHIPEMEAWLRQINADVVLIQEIPASYARNGIPSLRDLYPYQLPQRCADCIMTLSRYPFLSADLLPTSTGNISPFSLERITIQPGDQMVVIYNVHLNTPFRSGPRFTLSSRQPAPLTLALSYDDSTRNAQMQTLLARLSNEKLPFIIAGDFNTSDQAVIYRDLAAHMSDSFREVGMGLGASWPVNQIIGLPRFVPPLIRIDYIWHSAGISAVSAQQGPFLGSDHLPLYATLRLDGR